VAVVSERLWHRQQLLLGWAVMTASYVQRGMKVLKLSQVAKEQGSLLRRQQFSSQFFLEICKRIE
jgi:hypothetical protein